MKKYILSVFTILAFAGYVILQRNSSAVTITGSEIPPAIAPPHGRVSRVIFAPDQVDSQVEVSPATSDPAPVPTPDTKPAPDITPTPALIPTPALKLTGQYKDGVYVGDIADAYYGNVQVKTTIRDGRIANVQFLDYPHDRDTSRMINSQAMPLLKQEAIQTQNANVDIVSGATATSGAFQESLASALAQARRS